MRACWLKWVGRDWSISADYIWLNYSDANKREQNARCKYLDTVNGFDAEGVYIRDLMAGRVDLDDPSVNGLWAE